MKQFFSLLVLGVVVTGAALFVLAGLRPYFVRASAVTVEPVLMPAPTVRKARRMVPVRRLNGGDNGAITSYDAALIAGYAAGTISLNSVQRRVADVSDDGTISSFDAAMVGRYAVFGGKPR